MNRKTYELTSSYGGKETVFFAKGSYAFTRGLALRLYSVEDEFIEPYCSLTVCLPSEQPENDCSAFIDTNNCGEQITGWLEGIGAGKVTGKTRKSGFCTYPQFQFDKNFIDQLPYIEDIGF